MPLRQKLFLILGLITIVPLLVLLFGVVERVQRDLETRIESEIHSTLDKMSQEVDTLINSQKSLALGLARVPMVREFITAAAEDNDAMYERKAAALQSFFLRYQQAVPAIQAMRVIDRTGKTLVKVKEGYAVEPEFLDDTRGRYYIADQSHRPFFHTAITERRDIYISDFELGQVREDAEFCPAMLRYSIPIYATGAAEGIDGLLVVNMWGRRIDETVLAALGGQSGKVYIVEVNDNATRDGIYLYHDETNYRFANQLGTSYRFSTDVGEKNWKAIKRTDGPDTLLVGDDRLFFYRQYRPYDDRSSSWLLVVEKSRDAVFAPITRLRVSIWFLMGLLLVLSLLITRWLAERMARPVRELAAFITRYADGDQYIRYTERRDDEIGVAGKAFNYLCENLERTKQERDKAAQAAQQSERLAAVGHMAAGIGHEINNPLMNIMSLAALMEDSLKQTKDPQLKRDLKTLQEEGRRCARIIQGILNFARANEPSYREFDMCVLVRDTLGLLKHRLQSSGLRLQLELDESLVMEGDPNQLQQVLVNVLLNAIYASPRGETIRVSARDEGGNAVLEIADQGCGIGEDELARVFNPFYTTKPAGHGTGLGLSVSYGIVQEHGGEIVLESGSGRGTVVRITVPQYGGRPAADETQDEDMKTAEAGIAG